METAIRSRPVANAGPIRWAIVAMGVVALGVAAFFVVRALAGDDDQGGIVKGPRGAPFTMNYPAGWGAVSRQGLAGLPGSPLAALRRADRKGILIINREERPTRDFDKVSRSLDRTLESRIRDFKKVSSHTVRIPAGEALLYSYVRTRTGTVHTVVAVPAGQRGYAINAVVNPAARDAARQVGAMIRSFDVP